MQGIHQIHQDYPIISTLIEANSPTNLSEISSPTINSTIENHPLLGSLSAPVSVLGSLSAPISTLNPISDNEIKAKKKINALIQSLILESYTLDQQRKIAQEVTALPKNSRKKIVETIYLATKTITDPEHRIFLLKKVKALGGCARRVMKLALPFFQQAIFSIEFITILDSIKSIKKDKRELIVNLIKPYCYLMGEKCDWSTLVCSVEDIVNEKGANECSYILQLTFDLVKKYTLKGDLSKLIYKIYGIEKENRQEIIDLVSSIVMKIANSQDHKKLEKTLVLFGSIQSYPKKERKAKVTAMLSLFQDSPDKVFIIGKTFFMNFDVIKDFSVKKINKLIELSKSLFQGREISVFNRSLIFQALCKFPKKNRETVLGLIQERCRECERGIGIERILKAVNELDEINKLAVIKVVNTICNKIDADRMTFTDLIKFVGSLPKREDGELYKDFFILLEGLNFRDREDLHEFYSLFHQILSTHSIKEVVREIKAYNCLDDKQKNFNSEVILFSRLLLPSSIRLSYISACKTYLDDEIFTHIYKLSLIEVSRLVQFIFKKEESRFLVKKTHDYYLNLLSDEEVLKDQEKAFKISSFIMGYNDLLLINEWDPLYLKSFDVYSLSDPEFSKDKKNCYHIYSQHLKSEDEKVAYHYLPFETFKVGKKKRKLELQLNPLEFQKKIKKRVYTVADLPENIDEQTPEKLFKNMRERIGELTQGKQEDIFLEIKKITSLKFREVKNNFLQKEVLNFLTIPHLTTLREESRENEISKINYMFFQVMDYLDKLPKKINRDASLSVQELRLLNVAVSIAPEIGICSTGIKGTIAFVYNQILQNEQNISKQLESLPAADKGRELLQVFVQKILFNYLNKEELVKNLIREKEEAQLEGGSSVRDDIRELEHQCRFIRNRIGKAIGFSDQIEFDPHTGVLHNNLIKKTKEQIVSAFYQNLTPKAFFSEVTNMVNHSLSNSITSGLYEGLNAIFLELKGRWTGDQIWDLKDIEGGGEVPTIRKKAVMKLLLEEGYLKESPK